MRDGIAHHESVAKGGRKSSALQGRGVQILHEGLNASASPSIEDSVCHRSQPHLTVDLRCLQCHKFAALSRFSSCTSTLQVLELQANDSKLLCNAAGFVYIYVCCSHHLATFLFHTNKLVAVNPPELGTSLPPLVSCLTIYIQWSFFHPSKQVSGVTTFLQGRYHPYRRSDAMATVCGTGQQSQPIGDIHKNIDTELAFRECKGYANVVGLSWSSFVDVRTNLY